MDRLRMLALVLFVLNFFTSSTRSHWTDLIQNKYMLRFNYPHITTMLETTKNNLSATLKESKYKFLVCDDPQINLDGFTKIAGIDAINSELIKNNLFIVFFHTDDDYYYTLQKIKNNQGKFLLLHDFSDTRYFKTRYIWVDKKAMLAVDKTFSFGDKISHQFLDVHETICLCLNITKNLRGDYVEIGVFKGGSALTALHYMKYAGIKRKSYFFDTFDGMTYQEAHNSSDVFWDNTHVLWGPEETILYVKTLLQTTGQHFKLIQSNICQDTIPDEIHKIAVCNIDVDVYEATLSALLKVGPKIVKGGIIIAEDPASTPTLGGSLVAMEEFLATPVGKKFTKILHKAQYILIRTI